MAKRPTQLDRAIGDLEAQIRALEDELRGLTKARDCLILQQQSAQQHHPRPGFLPRPVARPGEAS